MTEGLKKLALAHGVPLAAVAAADSQGLKGDRVRFEDLWGGSSVKYEPDVAVMLSPSPERDEEQKTRVLFSIEKNRLGPTGVEFGRVLRGEHFVFE